MFSRAASALRSNAARAARRPFQQEARRTMGGGGHPSHYISPVHTMFGEIFGVICWVWVFHRFRMDGAVLLGYRHPWDHVDDPWTAHASSHGEDEHAMQEHWDGFYEKSTRPGEGDDDDEEEEDEDDEDDDDEDDE